MVSEVTWTTNDIDRPLPAVSGPWSPDTLNGWKYSEETSRREEAARAHIDAIYGTPEEEFGATLFVAHHLNELDVAYWMKHTGTSNPNARRVLRLLGLCFDSEEEDLEEEEGLLDTLDFTLPDGVTNYVICVEFDDSER